MRFFYRFFVVICSSIFILKHLGLSNPINQTNPQWLLPIRIDFLVLSHQDFECLNYDAQLLTPDLQDGTLTRAWL